MENKIYVLKYFKLANVRFQNLWISSSEAYSESCQTSKMEGKSLSSPLKQVATCGESSISDVWQEFEFAFVAIRVDYLFTKFD